MKLPQFGLRTLFILTTVSGVLSGYALIFPDLAFAVFGSLAILLGSLLAMTLVFLLSWLLSLALTVATEFVIARIRQR